MKQFFVKYSDYFITFLVGLFLTFAILLINNGFVYESLDETFKDLCDAFCISGFLLVSFGLLIFIGNDGGFSMLSYGIKKFFKMLKKNNELESFYEYKKKRIEKPAPFKNLLLVGLIFFAIGIIFLILFNAYSK